MQGKILPYVAQEKRNVWWLIKIKSFSSKNQCILLEKYIQICNKTEQIIMVSII